MELVVRHIHETEEATRRDIVETVTRELRRTYRPRESRGQCGVRPSAVLVVLKDGALVGTAEYVQKDNRIYIQGIAVHPEYRKQGVCRALVRAAEEIAKDNKLTALVLCAIEETGNVGIFKKLGFEVTSRAVASDYIDPEDGPVIQVNMERKVV